MLSGKSYFYCAAVLSAALVVAASGCNPDTRYKVAKTVFDDVPPPGRVPPTRRPVRRRRQLARQSHEASPTPAHGGPPPTPTPNLLPVERASLQGWKAVVKLLPVSVTGGPDWVAALEKGVIAPRAAPDPGTEAAEPFDHDVVLDPGIPGMKVVFPHKAHTEWLTCENCHTGIFQMAAGADNIKMAKIFAGEWCGKCHGRVAFAVTNCARCHIDM